MFQRHSRNWVRNHDLNSSKILKGLSAISLQPDEYLLVTSLTCYLCVRLTDNMMCNLAVELAMASTTNTVDTEDSPILNERDVHWNRLTGSSEPDGLMACRITGLGHFIYAQLSQLGSISKHTMAYVPLKRLLPPQCMLWIEVLLLCYNTVRLSSLCKVVCHKATCLWKNINTLVPQAWAVTNHI